MTYVWIEVYIINKTFKKIWFYPSSFLFELLKCTFNIRLSWEKWKGFAMYALLYYISQTIKKRKENKQDVRYI